MRTKNNTHHCRYITRVNKKTARKRAVFFDLIEILKDAGTLEGVVIN
jgi:hypothetical protein